MRSAAVAPAASAASDRKSTVAGSPSTAAVASVAPRGRRSASKQIWAPGSEQPQQPLAQLLLLLLPSLTFICDGNCALGTPVSKRHP